MPFPWRCRRLWCGNHSSDWCELAPNEGGLRDVHFFEAPGFVGADVNTPLDTAGLRALGNKLMDEYVHRDELPPDAWQSTVIGDPAERKPS